MAENKFEPFFIGKAAMEFKENIVPLNAKAVMPDGRLASREEILEKLGLNPGTPPDAWLAIVVCGSNASALDFRDTEILTERKDLDRRWISEVRRFTTR